MTDAPQGPAAGGENEGEISRFDVVLGFTAELARGGTAP